MYSKGNLVFRRRGGVVEDSREGIMVRCGLRRGEKQSRNTTTHLLPNQRGL